MALAAEAVGCADGGELKALDELAVAAVQFDEALGVGDVVGDEGVVHHGDVVELVLALGDDGLPVLALRMVEVDGDDFSVGSVERGADPEDGGRRCR